MWVGEETQSLVWAVKRNTIHCHSSLQPFTAPVRHTMASIGAECKQAVSGSLNHQCCIFSQEDCLYWQWKLVCLTSSAVTLTCPQIHSSQNTKSRWLTSSGQETPQTVTEMPKGYFFVLTGNKKIRSKMMQWIYSKWLRASLLFFTALKDLS